MKKIIIATAILFTVSGLFAQEKTCVDCHQGSQSSCNLSCRDCHSSANADFTPDKKDHPAIIKNPSLEKWWDEKCISCHKDYIAHFKSGLHYSTANIINQTRFLWGRDKILKNKANPHAWKELQNIGLASGHSPSALVDNLLAKKCMACHFNASGKNNALGKKRNAGCAACHIPLEQDTGKPLFGHTMQKTVKDETCLTCHGNNHVGADYFGFFEHDYHEEYATPYGTEPLFGTFQHRLIKDVHASAGMECSDCHRKIKDERKKIKSCEDCHGSFEKIKDKRSKKKELRIKNKEAPLFETNEIAHKDFHKNVACSACHAQWSFQDYGLHLFLDESDNFGMWETQKWQGDQTIIDLLDSFLEDEHELPLPQSANRLSGKSSRGVWYKGWTFRRWEDPVLGINKKGKYSIIRPMYQYYITYVDSNENVWLDSAIPQKANGQTGWSWDAYTPHTIGKSRACESCHENPKAAGLGIKQNYREKTAHKITLPSAPIIQGARLLTKKEQSRLLNKSAKYKKWRAKSFMDQGIEILLKQKE